MNKIISGWSNKHIEECCDILDNKRVPVNSEEREKRTGVIPYYGANGLQGYIDDFIFNEPLILIAEDGGNFNEFASRPIAYRIEGKSWVNNHAHVLRAKKGFCQNTIFYSLEHKDIQSHIVGGTRAKLNQSALRQISILIPDCRVEQTKIGEILETMDYSIEQTEALIAKQGRIKTGLMQDLLTRGIDENGNIRSEETHEFKDSILGRIPIEWQIGGVNNYVVNEGGIKPGPFGSDLTKDMYIQNGYRVYGQEQVIGGSLDIGDYCITRRKFLEMSTFSVKHNDVLISLVGTIGHVLIVPKNCKPGVINPRLLRFRPNPKVCIPEFFKLLLISGPVKMQLFNLATGGTMAVLSGGIIRKISVVLVEIGEQERIAKVIKDLDETIAVTTEEFKKLVSIKTALMQDLLTGNKRVTPLLKEAEVINQ